MKIAIIAPTHLPALRANTLQVMKMAQAFACLGHDARVVAPIPPAQPVSWEQLAEHYGLHQPFKVEWLPAVPWLRRYDYGLRGVIWARRIGADLVYTRLPQAGAISSTLGIPTILEMHDLPATRSGAWLFRRFLAGSGKRRLVAITQSLAADLSERLGSPQGPPFTVIAPDGVDLERYTSLPTPLQARQQLGLAEGFTAGYTGHLYAGRGIELIFILATRLPDMQFLVAGGEPAEVENMRQEAQSKGLKNISLLGYLPNARLPRYHAACDVLLMPYQRHVAASSGGDISRYLSPMKLFEYMACGRPILSSDLPVFGEVLSDRNAILLPPEDVNAWVTALDSLRDDLQRSLALGEQARRDASLHTWEGRAKTILSAIK